MEHKEKKEELSAVFKRKKDRSIGNSRHDNRATKDKKQHRISAGLLLPVAVVRDILCVGTECRVPYTALPSSFLVISFPPPVSQMLSRQHAEDHRSSQVHDLGVVTLFLSLSML